MKSLTKFFCDLGWHKFPQEPQIIDGREREPIMTRLSVLNMGSGYSSQPISLNHLAKIIAMSLNFVVPTETGERRCLRCDFTQEVMKTSKVPYWRPMK